MNDFREYWTFSSIRGALTLLAAAGILALPQVTASMLSLPVLETLAIAGWATYCIFDGVVLLLLGHLLPARATTSRTVYAQAIAGLAAGALLFLVGYNDMDARWLVGIGAAQAAFAAYAEWRVARDTHRVYGCLSCYATAIALTVATFALPIALAYGAVSLAVAAYAGLYGASELLTGSRMLFLEYRAGHPAAVASQAWRTEKTPFAAAAVKAHFLTTAKGCVSCEDCPADALCRDTSVAGEMRQIMAAREPAIVRTVRVATLLQTAHAGR
ncbi:hypothetical protein SAMN05421770_101154 [Granulicella rosea]|uniref:Uncharacterized protein n=1 Tax=Granulicella rosea TaxID=474952 RepID=A0A239CXZ4_9BACT|nr:hypothetical protein [Granulicella rosea]SNS24424.1 hypothetical protein SAMN05421770_101154 [Granulicella rosea]